MDKNSTRNTVQERPEFTPRQEEILDQALDLIRNEGMAGLTMRKLADRMGFSEPALYRYFKTKQDLELGIIKRLEIDLLQPMQVIAAMTGKSASERIGDIMAHHLELISTNNALSILLFAAAAVSPDRRLSGAMAKVFRAYETLLIKLLKEGRRAGEINPALTPADGAIFLMGAPTTCALRLRLLADPSSAARRRHLVKYVRSEFLVNREVNR